LATTAASMPHHRREPWRRWVSVFLWGSRRLCERPGSCTTLFTSWPSGPKASYISDARRISRRRIFDRSCDPLPLVVSRRQERA